MGSAVHKLENGPISLGDDIYNLAFAVRKSLPPAVLVFLVSLGADLCLAAGNVLKLAVIRDDRCAPVGVTQIPGFMPFSYDFFCFVHILLPYRVIVVQIILSRAKNAPNRGSMAH